METLDIIGSILKPILYFSLICLTVYIIISIKRVTIAVEKIEKNVDDISLRLEPVITETSTVMTGIKDISENVKKQILKVDKITSDIKDRTKEVVEFSKYLQNGIETPIKNTLSYLGAFSTGISVFYKKLKTS